MDAKRQRVQLQALLRQFAGHLHRCAILRVKNISSLFSCAVITPTRNAKLLSVLKQCNKESNKGNTTFSGSLPPVAMSSTPAVFGLGSVECVTTTVVSSPSSGKWETEA